MKKLALVFLAMHVLNCATDNQVIVHPERPLAPTRFYVATPYFMLLPVMPEFAHPMKAAYANANTMKYMGAGETVDAKTVEQRFLIRAHEMQHIQNPKNYYWCVITREGISGIIQTWTTDKNTMDVARLLLPSLQGKGQGNALFKAIFDYLPDQSWKVTSHPDNVASWKSQESAGFVLQKIEYVEKYKGHRKFYARRSNDAIDGQIKVYFSYSGKTVKLGDL